MFAARRSARRHIGNKSREFWHECGYRAYVFVTEQRTSASFCHLEDAQRCDVRRRVALQRLEQRGILVGSAASWWAAQRLGEVCSVLALGECAVLCWCLGKCGAATFGGCLASWCSREGRVASRRSGGFSALGGVALWSWGGRCRRTEKGQPWLPPVKPLPETPPRNPRMKPLREPLHELPVLLTRGLA